MREINIKKKREKYHLTISGLLQKTSPSLSFTCGITAPLRGKFRSSLIVVAITIATTMRLWNTGARPIWAWVTIFFPLTLALEARWATMAIWSATWYLA